MIRVMGFLLIVLLSASAYAENGCPRGYAWYQGKCVQVEKHNTYTVIPAPTQEQIDARPESQVGQGIGRLIGNVLGSIFSRPDPQPTADNLYTNKSGDIRRDDAEIISTIKGWSEEDCRKFIRGVWLVRRGWSVEEAAALIENKAPGQ